MRRQQSTARVAPSCFAVSRMKAAAGRSDSKALPRFKERLIFRLLEAEHPPEVERAKQDHEFARALLASLGMRTDLHFLRKDVADELIARLREHAEWKDRTVYPWAQSRASEETRRSLRELLMHEGT